MRTAVVAIHLQNDVLHPEGKMLAGVPRDERREELVTAARSLLQWARGSAVPVVSVRIAFPPGHVGVTCNSPIFRAAVASEALVEGSWGAEFYEGLGPVTGEAVVVHSRINAFHDSTLQGILEATGATRVLICGVATHSAVEHTARHAADLGYDVAVVEDACGAADMTLHEAALAVLTPHVTEVTTTREVIESSAGPNA